MLRHDDNLTAIRRRMALSGIVEEDIYEEFIHSPGKGGQHVNKVATCVHLFHRPTGIRVKCHQERSQRRNRIRARKILLAKIDEQRRLAHRKAAHEKARQQRQRRKRSPRAKEAILQKKKQHGQKKSLRHKISFNQIDTV